MNIKKVCIVGASGKLGQYMVTHALARGYEVVGVCRPQSVDKLAHFQDRITLVPSYTNDTDVIKAAVSDCDAVFTVLAPWGVNDYASGTVQAVLDHAPEQARLVFSSGWHISKDGKDVYGYKIRMIEAVLSPIVRFLRLVDIKDQHVAARKIFNSDRLWTLVRGSDLEEGASEGLPVWSTHVGDAVLESNITRRTDFALFMVEAAQDDSLIQKAPAIVSRASKSAHMHVVIT